MCRLVPRASEAWVRTGQGPVCVLIGTFSLLYLSSNDCLCLFGPLTLFTGASVLVGDGFSCL